MPNLHNALPTRAIIIVLLILIPASTVRLLTYDRYLPYIDYVDEPNYVALADEIRGYSDQTALRELYGLIAPLYVYTNVGVQIIHDAFKPHPWHIPGEYYYTLRLLSVFFGVCTALIIAWIGWQLGGPGAAAIAGIIWALSPIIIDLNSLAIPDPMLYLCCTLAVATGLAAWRQHSLAFLAVSLGFGIAAIYLKLWLATATIPFILISIALAQHNRRRILLAVLALYCIAALFALHFVLVLNPFQNTLKIDANLTNGTFISNLFNIKRMLNNFWYMIYPTDNGSGLSMWVLLLGGGAYWYCKRNGVKAVEASSLLIVGVYLVTTWWLSAGISNVNIDYAGRMRHIFPASVIYIPVWASCLVYVAKAGRHLLATFNVKSTWLAHAGISALLVVILTGFVGKDQELIRLYSRSHTTNQLIDWFDGSPPHEGVVLLTTGSKHEGLWNYLWGAYMGKKPYEWWTTPIDEISLTTSARYIERNIRWLILSDTDFAKSSNIQQLNAYLRDLLLVKTIIPQSGQSVGEKYYIYRFELPRHHTNFLFGNHIRLLGYDLSAADVTPGDSITLRFYWGLEHPIQQNLSVFVHLYSDSNLLTDRPTLFSQWDGELLPNGNRPTLIWDDTSEVYFGEPLTLSIPEDINPGSYVVAVGLYDYETLQRLSGINGASFYRIPITVSVP